MSVDVAAQHRCHVAGQLRARDHVGAVAEREFPGTARGSLHAVVEAEQLHVRVRCPARRGGEELAEARADVARVREPCEGDAHAPALEHDRARPVEDVEPGVQREKRVGDSPALVIAGEQQDRDPGVRDRPEGRQGGIGEPGRDAAPIQEVPRVEHRVHLPGAGGRKGRLEALEELGAAPRSRHAGTGRQVVAEVGVGEEEESHGLRPRAGRNGCTGWL